MAACHHVSPRSSRKNDRHVAIGVPAFCHLAAVVDEAVVEDGPAAFRARFDLVQKVGEKGCVEGYELHLDVDAGAVMSTVMRNLMMTHHAAAEFRGPSIVEAVAHGEAGVPSEVAFECRCEESEKDLRTSIG